MSALDPACSARPAGAGRGDLVIRRSQGQTALWALDAEGVSFIGTFARPVDAWATLDRLDHPLPETAASP